MVFEFREPMQVTNLAADSRTLWNLPRAADQTNVVCFVYLFIYLLIESYH